MNMPNKTQSDPIEQTILIIEDNPTNLKVLAGYLEDQGFTILVARDGDSGLQKACYAQPDLILLDVMMPGIDGFETCRRLKARDETQHIPVIFMTALATTEDKIRGFTVGAVDYVTKPLNQDEVVARITAHLKIQALTRRLQLANEELERLNTNKDKFFALLAHDLRVPFSALLLHSRLLSTRAETMDPRKITDISNSIYQATQQIWDLLENLLQWARLQMGRVAYEPIYFDIAEMVSRNLMLFAPPATAKGITLHNHITQATQVYADPAMLETVIRNLLSNAVKFTPQGGKVTVYIYVTNTVTEISIGDTGVGISADALQNLFKLGEQHTTPGTAKEAGTGLGLVMCQEMIAKNGGEIRIESAVNVGTTVKFTVPNAPHS